MRTIGKVGFGIWLMASGCATLEQGAANALMPPEQEASLAKQVDGEIHQKLKMVEDPAIVGYVRQLGQKIGKASEAQRGPVTLHFEVVDDPKTVNAFATMGGNIYVYSGLMLAAKTEDQLASVLAHEIAHVAERHVARSLATQFGLELLAKAALGESPGAIKQMAAQIAGAGVMAAHTRGEERQADQEGLRDLIAAGYDPRGMIEFFGTLARMSGGKPNSLVAFFQTHPPPEDRQQYLSQQIEQLGAAQGPRQTRDDRYAEIVSRLEGYRAAAPALPPG